MDLTASKELNTADGNYPSVHNVPNALIGTPNFLIVLHAYEVSLAASKEKEQQLQSELEETRCMYQDKDQLVSKLKEELQAEQKKMASLTDQFEQQQGEVGMLQQNGKTRANVVDSVV